MIDFVLVCPYFFNTKQQLLYNKINSIIKYTYLLNKLIYFSQIFLNLYKKSCKAILHIELFIYNLDTFTLKHICQR